MKKATTVFSMLLALLLLVGCFNQSINNTESSINYNVNSNIETIQKGDTILPKVKKNISQNAAELFSKFRRTGFIVLESLSKEYYGYKVSLNDFSNMYGFYNFDKDSFVELKESNGIESFLVSSGSTTVLQDKYFYEWQQGYDYPESQEGYNLKLFRVDVSNKKAKVVNEMYCSTPLIYLCKINEKEFLSYCLTQKESKKTLYSVASTAWLCNENGEKEEIINERYENDVTWSDSEGILIERFFSSDGEIYGLGRRNISGKYRFFIYHYDKNGVLLDEKHLANLENIIGTEQFVELLFVNGYFAFRTYESLTTYICKATDNVAELIMKGSYGKVQYAISGDYLLFIESNVDSDTAKTQKGDFPLYIVDTVKNEIYSVKFSIDLKDPYFVGFISLSNGDVVISYCENGEYTPEKVEQFVITKSELYKAAKNWF